jgi:hypothetical protein
MKTIRDRRWKSDGGDKPWDRLTEGWRELQTFLGALLPFGLREVEFVGPAASLSFAVPNLVRPRGVLLVSLYREDSGATDVAAFGGFAWTYANQAVTTTAFSGVAATKWRATFLIIGGAS